jgi:acetyl esterase/lipase
MAEREDVIRVIDGEPICEDDLMLDITDPKWGHPRLRDNWLWGSGDFEKLYDPMLSIGEKKKVYDAIDLSIYFKDADTSAYEMKEYMVPGCPEEPETEAHVYVVTPNKLKGKKNCRALFLCVGGGMVYCDPPTTGIQDMATKFDCVVVSPKYRISLQAPYPAAINDLHAAYAWMIDNADMLGIDPDNVVIRGDSSGGTMATSIPFRLKRYGYHPKGVIAGNPITDERETMPSSQTCLGNFDGRRLHTAYRMWLGYNYDSGRVGPEAMANHATVEDCIGYPPTMIFTAEFDPDRDYNREFVGKLYEARTFCEYHCWGGTHHGLYIANPDMQAVIDVTVDNMMNNMWDYDLRRPWVIDEYRERMERKIGEYPHPLASGEDHDQVDQLKVGPGDVAK